MQRVISAALCWWSLAAPGAAFAQGSAPAGPGAEALVATAPIRCWWKSASSAVFVGQRFQVTLTCGLIDTPAVRVVVDPSRLDPTSVQLPPFDVVTGARNFDIVAAPRRFFQYQYSLRVIAEDLFGREVALPPIDISYRVQNTENGAAVESIEQMYRLPPLPIRVMSLVSPQAADIRDAPTETFADIQSRRFRGNVAFAMAALLFGAGLICVALALVGTVRRYRTPATHTVRLLSDDGVLRRAIGELEQVRRDVLRDGWTRDLAGRALTALRLGIALALGQRPPQTMVDLETADREGALIVRRGLIRPKRLMVSASVTAEALAPGRETGGGDSPNAEARRQRRAFLDDFNAALAVLTAGRYSREEPAARGALDGALAEALDLLQRLRVRRAWRNRASAAVARMIADRRAWAR